MKRKVTLILIILINISVFAQKNFDKKPEIRGTVWDFTLKPNGTLWLCSDSSQVLSFNPKTKNWTSWDTQKSIEDQQYGHIHFFNNEIGIIYGFIKNDGCDLILRTEDGGKSWATIKLPYGGFTMWVNSSILNSDGTGILGSTDYIYKTTDFGKTWKMIANFPNGGPDESPCDIFMTETNAYFVSCEFNTLKKANLDFSKVEKAYMPSDQGLVKLERSNNGEQQYAKLQIDGDGNMSLADISNEISSQVENITLLKNDLFILQEGKIFYSDKAILDWKPLSELNFIKMTSNNDNVFAIDENFKVYEIDNQKKLKLFNPKIIAFHPWKFMAKDNVLYILNFTTNQIGIITEEDITYE